jgi:hypothetical protein
VEMPPCRPPLKARAAIEQYYSELFQGPVKVTAFTFSHMEAASAGDLGYTAGTYARKLSGGPTGSIEDTGKFGVIVKRSGSAWKAAYVIYNTDHQPENLSAALWVLPSPERDLTALFRAHVQAGYSRLGGLGQVAAAVGSLALISLLLWVRRDRSAEPLALPQYWERLAKAQQRPLRPINRAAGARPLA